MSTWVLLTAWLLIIIWNLKKTSLCHLSSDSWKVRVSHRRLWFQSPVWGSETFSEFAWESLGIGSKLLLNEKYNLVRNIIVQQIIEQQHKIILKLLNPKPFVTSRNIIKVIKYTEEERWQKYYTKMYNYERTEGIKWWKWPLHSLVGWSHHRDKESSQLITWYFVFRVLPFGWKASAYLCHSLGLIVTSAIRSWGVPISQYRRSPCRAIDVFSSNSRSRH